MRIRDILTTGLLALVPAACGPGGADPGADGGAVAAGGAGGATARAAGDDGNLPPGPPQPGPQEIYGFEVWIDDLPGAPASPHISPRRPGLVYDRTRSQAIESITGKLQGNCTRDAWLFAKDFFSRVEAHEDLDTLIRTLDEALQTAELADLAENCLEAMGRAENPYCAPAILRGLEHSKVSIRNKAMRALVQSGDAAAVREAFRFFDVVEGRGMEGWIQAAARHLPDEELGRTFRGMLADPRMRAVHKLVVKEAVTLDPKVALEVFRDFVGREPPEMRALMSVLRHRSGDGGGSAMVKDMLSNDAPQVRQQIILALSTGGAEDFLDELLRATTDPDPTVRLAVVNTLSTIEGESVDLALDGMTLDEFVDVRRAALAALASRGFTAPLEELVEVVRRATGTRLQAAMEDLVSSQYPGAVPVLAERMADMTGESRKRMIRAIAMTTTAESFLVLRDEFLRDGEDAEQLQDYVAYMMANSRGAELAVVELLNDLAPEDHRRRAMLLRTLGNIAADRQDPEIKEAIYSALREVVADQQTIPQLRLLALEYGRRGLGPEHVSWLKVVSRAGGRPMRNAISDMLFEFF